MDRLTPTREWREQEGIGYALCLKPEICGAYDERIAAYEDTGLTPDEVGNLIPPALARRILRNCLSMATKRYQERNTNWAKVRDYLLYGRATKQQVSMAACVAECERIGIDPYAFEIDEEGD